MFNRLGSIENLICSDASNCPNLGTIPPISTLGPLLQSLFSFHEPSLHTQSQISTCNVLMLLQIVEQQGARDMVRETRFSGGSIVFLGGEGGLRRR